MEDNTIILLLKTDTSQGLYEATKKYGGIVKGISIKILHDRTEDIEECVADTFVNLWKNVDSIDIDKGSLKGYIASIARNTAINRYNKLKREQTDYIQNRDFISEEDLEDQIARECDIAILQELINDMGEPDKEIFIRRFFLFEKVKDIANKLQITIKTVDNKLFRGKQKLRKQLIERGITL
ncbi:sigma-70 family RNA polymerase sigma factor [Vallitalea sediminicola]